MTKTFAITGKGGTGKTTLSALIIKYLLYRKKIVLAVDGDPNSNLDSKLGVCANLSIGMLREDIMKNIELIPVSISKSDFFEYKLRLGITESTGFDLIVMGRPEGTGCYCYVNQVLRTCIDKISEQYDYVVIDCEAGMEHLSRRTTRDIDFMIVVSDYTKEGILTACRIKKLAEEMALKVKDFRLVINFIRSSGPSEQQISLKKLGAEIGFDLSSVSLLPYDENIVKCSLENYPIISISEDSVAYNAVVKLVSTMI